MDLRLYSRAHVACSRRLVKIHWKKVKVLAEYVEDPPFLKAGDQALVTLSSKETPAFLDTYENSPGLGRIAVWILTLIMLGRVQNVRYKTVE